MVIAFHKPYGVLCQFTPDWPQQRTLADFEFPKKVYPLGRLDMDSEGLLLLSDEPGLNYKLLNPRHAHPRTYFVQVEGIPKPEAMQILSEGSIIIRGHRCLPCEASILCQRPETPPREPPVRFRKEVPDTWIRITLTEGKNRQVRRMTAAIGNPTLRLIRIGIGNFSDPSLVTGKWREIDSDERNRAAVEKSLI